MPYEKGFPYQKKTAVDKDPDDTDDSSGEEPDYGIDDKSSDRYRRSDKQEEAKETDRSGREITAFITEWEKVTSLKHSPYAKKSCQLATARGLVKIRDPESCDGKSQKWRDHITFDQWSQRVVKWLLWQEYDIQGKEDLERASDLLTDRARICYDMYQRQTEPEDRNIHSILCLLREKPIPKISRDELWN